MIKKGVYAAGLSVLNADRTLNIDATINHASEAIQRGLHGVFFFGSTGQSQLISSNEKRELIAKIASHKLRKQFFLGTGNNSLNENIDLIRKSGIRFDNFYANSPVCSPTRASIMSGLYPDSSGVPGVIRTNPNNSWGYLREDIKILPVELNKLNYYTALIGKWHLGATKKHHPLKRGFQEFYGHLGGGHQYMPEMLNIEDSYAAKDEVQSYRTWILKGHKPVPPRKYLTDDFSDEAVSFIERNHKKPFFLFLSYNAPHTPLQAPQKLSLIHI